jgi:hypothetical protein
MSRSCDVILIILHVKTQNFSQNLAEALFYTWREKTGVTVARTYSEESKFRYCSSKMEYVKLLENQQRWQAKKSEQLSQLSKQKAPIKILETVKNILNQCLNTETLNPYTCLRHFSILFMKEGKGLLLMEVQIIDWITLMNLLMI